MMLYKIGKILCSVHKILIKIPMKSQVMAIITLHKFVADSIEDFRKKFPDWNKTVPSLIKKRKKKRKLNVEIVSGANKKLQNEVTSVDGSDGEGSGEENDKLESEDDDRSDNRSNSDDEEESVVSSSGNERNNGIRDRGSREIVGNNEEEVSESGSDTDGEESDEEEETEKNLESEGENDKLLSSDEESQNDSEADTKTSTVNNLPGKSMKRHLQLPKTQPVNKKLSKIEAKTHNKSKIVVKSDDEDKESVKCSSLKKSLKQKVVKEKPKVVDPFFMTTTNEEFLTSQVPAVVDNKPDWKNKSDDLSQTRFDKSSKFSSGNKWSSHKDDWKRNKSNNREFNHSQKPFPQRPEKASFNNGSEPFNIFTNRKERRKALQQPPQEAKVEKLHPSWEAKKKQTAIASFQGKKITFD